MAAALANPTAPTRAAHIDKVRVVRSHAKVRAARHRAAEEEEGEEEEEEGGGENGSAGAGKKRKPKLRAPKKNQSASGNACPRVSAYDRAKEFPRSTIFADGGKLFCEACGLKLLSKKATIQNYVNGRLHIDAVARFDRHKKQKQVSISYCCMYSV